MTATREPSSAALEIAEGVPIAWELQRSLAFEIDLLIAAETEKLRRQLRECALLLNAAQVERDEARAQGRREGLEEAAQLAEMIADPPSANARGHSRYIAAAIRALAQETSDE